MNNDNPLVPQGSLLEQKNKSRSRVKTAFFCVLAVHVLAILTALIAQGCKREQPPITPEPQPPVPTFEPTNQPPVVDPNMALPVVNTNMAPPVVDTAPPSVVQPAAVTEHVIARGDSFYSIGKKYGVTMKAIADANPGVDSSKLKIGQKINIPAAAPAAPVAGGVATPAADAAAGTQTYTVKSGDTLTKIAAQFGVTVRSLRSANNLSTDRIKVGDKLKIPVKAAAPAPAPAPAAVPVVPEAAPSAAPTPAPPQ